LWLSRLSLLRLRWWVVVPVRRLARCSCRVSPGSEVGGASTYHCRGVLRGCVMGLLYALPLSWTRTLAPARVEPPSCVERLPLRCPCRHRRICSGLWGGGGLMYGHLRSE
jgi:hypothetical protein